MINPERVRQIIDSKGVKVLPDGQKVQDAHFWLKSHSGNGRFAVVAGDPFGPGNSRTDGYESIIKGEIDYSGRGDDNRY